MERLGNDADSKAVAFWNNKFVALLEADMPLTVMDTVAFMGALAECAVMVIQMHPVFRDHRFLVKLEFLETLEGVWKREETHRGQPTQ